MKTFRIPLGGPYITRQSAVNSLNGNSGYVGLGIVGIMIVGYTASQSSKDARMVNCFLETVSDPVTGQRRIYTVKRPGFTTSITPRTGHIGNAILIWTGLSGAIVSAFGNSTSNLYNGTTNLGAITGLCTGITETFVSAVPTLVLSSSDSTAWYYDVPTGSATKITDADFPGNAGKTLAGTFAHIDGYACIMTTDGGVYASDLNSVTAWTATSFDSANSYPDMGVGLVRHRNFIMAFGTESIQFFYNAGQTPFPLAKANAMTVKVGAVSAGAIAQISDTTFWCGSTPQGSLSIFQYDGGLSRISTAEVDAILILAGAGNITLTTIRFFGRSFVIVRASTTTMAYCIEEKAWHEWSSVVPLWYKCVGVSQGTMVNYAITNQNTSGKIYVMNQLAMTFQDDSQPYSAMIQLAPQDLGTDKRKFYSEVTVIGDVETSSSQLIISYSDDDYQGYTTWGSVDLSEQRRKANRLGSSRRRAWVLTHAANTPMRLEALEIAAKVGTS